ncbi:gluconate 2-dehydrogenase subunit 3 family protein [Calidithermus chliarophilus]|uniref:gluconate 2-dehydrogenase subunit 3 family protein n=1 Tax=Calidithermus chliarophilus TaxID=52023 RepID=UPI000A010594|nr:gluconate 2-dehydrogenase subunit 3 family protein [Calidithermus chliarophilus]
MAVKFDRRSFLKVVGGASLGALVGGGGKAQGYPPPPMTHQHPQAQQVLQRALAAHPQGYTFFNSAEAAFMEAVVARLIPSDALGPGGLEAGCAYFIDQQLNSMYGHGGRWYMQGPWEPGQPEQGYQLPLKPREIYRLGIAATNRYCARTYSRTFDRLSAQQKDTVLKGLEEGSVELGDLPARTFFNMMLSDTMKGYFADPAYGGNRGKVGWRLVGFPGVAAAYVGFIEQWGKPYEVDPVSIPDLLGGQAQVDEHGHPIHRPVARR